ncbi:uncharacterized protein LOC131851343 [Achroia grisella]|uniref:uncharacterized protein LOC131851343 n=1 Tax=Achroia grisella TaxID=688607 RepID=UPI0027D266F7|nr:uncharacterized protein LOC131851343 [Achroia grisella]
MEQVGGLRFILRGAVIPDIVPAIAIFPDYLILASITLPYSSDDPTSHLRIQYFSTEHPNITYWDTNYFEYVNVSSRRHSRKDPFYYVDIHAKTVVTIGNNFTGNFYFYEFLSNQYKRGFVEMHFKFCDLVLNNKFFGAAMKKNIKTCPLPVGEHHLYNMTIPIEQVPRGFPFTKGRIYVNGTVTDTNKVVVAGYIDLELKEFIVPTKT